MYCLGAGRSRNAGLSARSDTTPGSGLVKRGGSFRSDERMKAAEGKGRRGENRGGEKRIVLCDLGLELFNSGRAISLSDKTRAALKILKGVFGKFIKCLFYLILGAKSNRVVTI